MTRILIRIPRSEGDAWGPQHSGLSTVPTTRHPVEVAAARFEQVGLGFLARISLALDLPSCAICLNDLLAFH